ncbi:MAG: hypothetical protein ACPGVG_11840 [Mycobacterium sp.]
MVGVVGTGVTAAQEVVGPDDGEAHEVLHNVSDTFWILIGWESVDAVVGAGIQGRVGRVDAHRVDMAECRRAGLRW